MATEDFHGWSVGGQALHVGYLPGRKSCCLYELRNHWPRGASIHPLAYFRSEEDARRALTLLDALATSPFGGTNDD